MASLSSQVTGIAGGGKPGQPHALEQALRRVPPILMDVMLAVAMTGASVLGRLMFADTLEYRQPYITAFPALLVLALFRGTRSATMYFILALILHTYYFVPVVGSLRLGSNVDAAVLLSFVMVGGMLLGVSHAQRMVQVKLMRESRERRRAEEEVRRINTRLEERVEERTRQFQEANRELEAFSYSVSHDLRAPLRHIAGFSDMLIKRIDREDSPLDEVSRRYVSVITEAVARAGSLVDDLLAFSRMGRADMMESEVNTRRMVDEVVRDFQEETRKREIRWIIGELPPVHADPAMLRLVWRNLLDNAVKYSRRSSPAMIEIGSRQAPAGKGDHAGTDTTRNEVVFFVRDNGVGFDMKYVDKLFGVFQRLHRNDEFEGTGIGLANVRRIIQRHGGRTWAEAVLGEGATFFFTLPGHRERTGVA